MGRAPCCDKSKVKRGPWSPEEDTTLKNHIERFGTGGNWIALPHKAGLKRCGKSCRLRWLNYLRPNIKHGGFTEEEDDTILTLYINIGSRWSVIASHLPGRTDNDVKNYWNTKLKKKLLARNISAAASTTTSAATNDHNGSPFTSHHPIQFSPPTPFPRSITESNAFCTWNSTISNPNWHEDFSTSSIVQNPTQFPLPTLMEIQENIVATAGFSSFGGVSSSQDISISPSFSLENNNYGEADGFLPELESGSSSYDHNQNGFDFQEKFTENGLNFSNYSSLITNIADCTDEPSSLGFFEGVR